MNSVKSIFDNIEPMTHKNESTLYLPECQGTSCSKQAQYLNFK